MKKIFFLLVFCFFFLQLTLALNPFIKNYTISQGFPTNKVTQICKDSKGFLWFATNVGVIRFDGNNLIYFTMEDGLSDNLVLRIKEDNSGRLWFLNRNGTANYYYQNTIYNEKNAPFLKSLKTDFFLFDFYEDSDSTLYFYNAESEVFVIKDNEIIDYRDFGLNNNTYIGGLQRFNKSFENKFLLWTSHGIFEIEHIDDSLKLNVQPFTNAKVFPISKLNSISLDIRGFIHQYEGIQPDEKKLLVSTSLLVNSIIVDSEGLIWVATYDKGIFCFDDEELLLHLNILQAQDILADKENNIWICSGVSGIFKINRDILKYDFLDSEIFYERGVKGLGISDNNDILATNGNQLFVIHDKKSYPVNQKIDSDILSKILTFNNTVYINGASSNLFSFQNVHFDTKTQTISYQNYAEYGNVLIKRDLVADPSTNSFYGFINDDLLIFNPYENGTRLHEAVVKLNKGRINNLFSTNEGDWVVNTSGNYTISLDSISQNKFSVYLNNTLNPLNGKVISAHLKIDGKNELFTVQENDIYLLNNKTFYNITQGIKAQIDYPIVDIAYGDSTLFFFTLKTVYFIPNPLKVVDNKPIEINRLNIEFNDINDLIIKDNVLHVASEDGLIFIPVEDCKNAELKLPKPYIYRVLLDDHEYNLSSGLVEFSNKKRLSIEFASLNFSSFPSSYTYMLEGDDENWIQANETRVVYSNLPPGSYTFKLRAKKSIGDIYEEMHLPIFVRPTFFQKTSVRLLLLSLILFTVYIIVRAIYNNKIIKKETENTLITLEHKALQSMMNPHFIFNALGSIQRYLLQNKSEEAGTYLSQFARLIRQNMNSLRSNFIHIDDEIERLRNYLELEKFRMNNKFNYSIEVDDRIDGDEAEIPSMIVQPFVENAIWHGISSLPENGDIKINFKFQNEKCVLIEIKDNGVGMNKTRVLLKSENNLNMSVSITEKRLELMGKQKEIDTKITYEELNPGAQYPGTKVKLIVPLLT